MLRQYLAKYLLCKSSVMCQRKLKIPPRVYWKVNIFLSQSDSLKWKYWFTEHCPGWIKFLTSISVFVMDCLSINSDSLPRITVEEGIIHCHITESIHSTTKHKHASIWKGGCAIVSCTCHISRCKTKYRP